MSRIIERFKSRLILVLVILFACNNDDGLEFTAYTEESFPDLTIAVISGLETPFESIFNPVNGRLTGDAPNLVDISDKLAEIFPDATVLEAESGTHRGLEIWEIKLKMASGGIVKLIFVTELGEIIRMKGKPGPFDYEIDSGGSFIPFSVARRIALATIDGEIVSWRLQVEENNEWEYEFHMEGFNRRFEVEISGVGEHVIAVKEKHEGEDEDNDGSEDDGEREDEDDRGDGDDDDDEVAPPTEILEFVQGMFEGELAHSEMHNRDNGVYWKIYLINSFEAVVKFIVKEEPLTLIEIEGERGPFEYQVEPGMDLLNYSEVREKVLREAEGHIDQWELEMDHHEDDLIWVYNFDVVGDAVKYKIVINAFSGEFIVFEVHD